ncbi:MAG TPA: sigma-70 family RNA polymerase sigma factor [Terriglobia bacterium]|nr:sigma-70 family RNA polymerase sigma factor [Terriglobia bacterium]
MADTMRSIAIPLEGVISSRPDESDLVRELKAGSEEAFAYLLAVYRKPVYSLVYHMIGNESDAADILQNVFVKIIRSVRTFHEESSLKTWVFRIAVHETSNYRRSWFRRKRREVFSLDDDAKDPAAVRFDWSSGVKTPYEELEQSERQELVKTALRGVAEPFRTVLLLREIEGFSYDEIAAVLRVAEGTVKSRLVRGREVLRQRVCSLLRENGSQMAGQDV